MLTWLTPAATAGGPPGTANSIGNSHHRSDVGSDQDTVVELPTASIGYHATVCSSASTCWLNGTGAPTGVQPDNWPPVTVVQLADVSVAVVAPARAHRMASASPFGNQVGQSPGG